MVVRLVDRLLPPDSAELVWADPVPPSPRTKADLLRLAGIDSLADNRDIRLLDFGCGEGRYLRMFGEVLRPENLNGCDINHEGLAKAASDGFSVDHLDQARAVLPYPDTFFDTVFSSNVIEHIPRPLYLCYLEEIHRVLKPGGVFVVGAPNYPIKRLFDMGTAIRVRRHRRYYLFDDPTHCNKMSVLRVERDLARWFEDIHLSPSRLPFERWFRFMHDQKTRHRLRLLGNKYSGACRKPRTPC